MSIKSKIKSAAKKAYGAVKNAVNNVASVFSGTKASAASINALNYNNPGNNALQANLKSKGGKQYSPEQPTGKDKGGATYYNNYVPQNASAIGYQGISTGSTQYGPTSAPYGPAKPTSFSSGTKSTYNGPSYNPNQNTLRQFQANVPAETTFSAAGMSTAATAPYALPSAPGASDYQGTALEGNVALGADASTGMINTEVAQTQNTEQDAFQTMLANLKEPVNQQDQYLRAERESGIQQKQQQVMNTQNEINGITAKMNQDLLSLRGTAGKEGVVEAVYGGQQAQVTREAAIRLLPLQAQLAADQGALEMAQSRLDTLFKIYSKDAENSVNFYNDQVKAIYQNVSDKEKRQLEANSDQKKFEMSILKDGINFQQSIASQAMKDGNVRLYKAITSIQPPTNVNSKSYTEDRIKYQEELNEAVGTYAPAAKSGGGVLATLPVSIQNKVLSIATGFESKDIVKKYNATVDAINVVNGIDPKSKNPADHQQVVYAFAKALDPDSAVREGEYATIKKYAQSSIDKYRKEISNALNGTGFLSENAIRNIQATMNQTYTSRKPIYDNAVSETSRVINNVAGGDVAGEIIADYSGGVSNQQSGVTPELQSLRTKYNY